MQSEWDDLELQQYARLYEADDVILPDLRRSRLRYWIYGGACMVAALLFAGFAIRIPDEITIPFVLRDAAAGQVYRYPHPVYIETVYVAPGARIQSGDALLKITAPEIVRLIGTQRAAADALDAFCRHRQQTIDDTRSIDALSAQQLGSQTQHLRQALAIREQTWGSKAEQLRFELAGAERKLEQHQALFSSRHVSALELRTAEAELLRAREALATASGDHIRETDAMATEQRRLAMQRRSITHESDRQRLADLRDSLALVAALSATQAAIQNTFGKCRIEQGSLVLLASGTGVVSFVFDGERELPQGAILLRLLPADGGLYASAVTGGELIVKLRQNQVAQLRFPGLPVYEWGTAQGHIERLSLTPDEKGAFAIRVAIDHEHRLRGRLQSGMTGRMGIRLDEHSFFEYFLRNLRSPAVPPEATDVANGAGMHDTQVTRVGH